MSKKYTKEIVALIIKNGAMSRKELAQLINSKFGTSYTRIQIQAKCTSLGLKASTDGRLKKGGAAWNKGVKNSTGYSKTRWKKGNIPHTAAPVGYERINRDGHVEVKVEGQRQMVYKHHWVWQQANGPIPNGHALIFRNGIKTDCRLDNLMLVSRAELLAMNRKFKELQRPETRETVALLAKLYVQSQNIGKVA